MDINTGAPVITRDEILPQDDGVLVRTAESWEGDPVTAQPETMQGALDQSLRGWLENLKRTAEDRAGSR
ncbi:MAG: hypothetical protein M3046_07780 [Actinomycetota bacterium]|nr:hypothetical protein [Actinomycetota bacterium]